MIISHQHKFIFIKTEKTAGTSIEIALSQFCQEQDIITPLIEKDELFRQEYSGNQAQNYYVHLSKYNLKDWGKLLLKGQKRKYYHHIGASEIEQLIDPKIWNSYYKFAFERNPWDKVISWYYWTYKQEPRPTIKEFIKSGYAAQVKGWSLYTIDGSIAIDRVCFYENLHKEMQTISWQLGLGDKLELPHSKGSFRKTQKSYQELLDEEDRENISQIFAKEIEHFNYTF